MSQQDINEVLKQRKTYRIQWPEVSEEEVCKRLPLPAGTPAVSSSKPPPLNQTNSKNSTGSKRVKSPSTPPPKKFMCKALTLAEISRQETQREKMAMFLSLFPSVDNSIPLSLQKSEDKTGIYPVVVQMMRDSSNTVLHFQEAFDFYPWLPSHDPLPEEDPSKKTLLHHACFFNRPDVLDLLVSVKYVVKCNAQDEKGFIPLHAAAKCGNLKCLGLLYERAFAYLDYRDFDNRTPLMVAAYFNQKEAVKQLLEWGANTESKDSRQATAYDLARQERHPDVVEIIRAFKAAQSLKKALVTALKRWTTADRLNRRLYEAWQHSDDPHISPVDNVQFNYTPAHSTEAENVELVRTNSYDVSSQRNYFGNKQGHSELFVCLAYLGAPLICSRADCVKALHGYETHFRTSTGLIEVHPLYFLAVIRLIKDDALLRKILLSEFIKKYPSGLGRTVERGGWLTVEEEKVAKEEGEPAKEPEVPPPETIRDKWNKFATAAKLSKAQREPMDELMALTGLLNVKELALDLYIEAQENNFKTPKEDSTPREYNFAFLGNPGTGKTTVARLLAKILEATGLRAGHKMIQMTASSALRIGVQQFSNELAALTGGENSIAPPPDPALLRKGLNVEVKHNTKWFPGKIARVNKGQKARPVPPTKPNEPAPAPVFDEVITYDILYPDGTEDAGMSLLNDKKESVVRVIDKSTATGGILFLDEAYDLDPENNRDGRHIMADIMQVAEDCRDKVSIILAGYKDDIENKLYAYNSGMRDRFRAVVFDDFNENELLEVWEGFSKAAGWNAVATPGQMDVSRVAARRLAQRCTVKGFANARSVRQFFNDSVAVAKRRPGHNKMLIVEDVIGVPPIPERIPALAEALKELYEHIGIPLVKEAVSNLCDVARKNYDKELNGMKTDQIPLNRLFLGNPGTGKSTIASIYGRILKNLMLLSKGEVIQRAASDFIGAAIGTSEEKTKGILSLAKGCVLIIDEAYNLNDQNYGKVVLNTIVENVDNKPGSDIAVIMIGYEKQMLAMLNDQNPGLRSRFSPTDAFRFEDFSDLELLKIFSSACAKDQVDVPIDIKCAAVSHLAKQRNMKYFGNARSVITLLSAAKSRMNSRIQKDPNAEAIMTLEDVLGEDADLKANPLQCIDELQGGNDEYGFRTVLRQIGNSINVCRRENRPCDAVGNFIFTGAPGTGKTTVASKMAKMLHALGVLASNHVVITSALDLTGQFVGQSKKVLEGKMEEARGGVLFIDEAYKLGEGTYGEEVMVKFLGMLTEPEYSNGKTVVILAGYEQDMMEMLSRNAGMASRFNERIHFSDWAAQQCVDLVENMGVAEKPRPFQCKGEVCSILLQGFEQLLPRPNWANARDSESMYKYLKKSRDRRMVTELNTSTLMVQKSTENCLYFIEEDARLAVATFLRNRPAAPTPSLNPLQQFLNSQFNNAPTAPPPMATDYQVPPVYCSHAHTRTAAKKANPKGTRDEDSDSDNDSSGYDDANDDMADPGEDTFSSEERVKLERQQKAYEAQVHACTQELATLQAHETARVEEMQKMKAEKQRNAEIYAVEVKRIAAEKQAQLDELARIEAEKKAEYERQAERARVAAEEALRKVEAEKQEELRKKQEAERLRREKEEEERRKAHLAEVERLRVAAEKAERERIAAEEARRKEEARRQEQERARLKAEQEREAARLAELERIKVEAQKQQVIRSLGMCEAGFAWIKNSRGYTCAGGSHHITDAEVNRRYKQMYG